MPNITYGSQFSPINSFTVSSNTSGNVGNALLITALTNKGAPQSGQKSEDFFDEVKIIPTTAQMSTIGCPIIQRGDQFYVDLKSNTTADNVYAVQSVSHNISPGKFNTSVSLMYVSQTSAQSLSKKIENVIIDNAPEIKSSVDADNDGYVGDPTGSSFGLA